MSLRYNDMWNEGARRRVRFNAGETDRLIETSMDSLK